MITYRKEIFLNLWKAVHFKELEPFDYLKSIKDFEDHQIKWISQRSQSCLKVNLIPFKNDTFSCIGQLLLTAHSRNWFFKYNIIDVFLKGNIIFYYKYSVCSNLCVWFTPLLQLERKALICVVLLIFSLSICLCLCLSLVTLPLAPFSFSAHDCWLLQWRHQHQRFKNFFACPKTHTNKKRIEICLICMCVWVCVIVECTNAHDL